MLSRVGSLPSKPSIEQKIRLTENRLNTIKLQALKYIKRELTKDQAIENCIYEGNRPFRRKCKQEKIVQITAAFDAICKSESRALSIPMFGDPVDSKCDEESSLYFYTSKKSSSSHPGSRALIKEAASSPVEQRRALKQLEKRLSSWVSEGAVGEQRAVAKTKILQCFEYRSTILNLKNLGLRSLPSEIGQLIALKELDLSRNEITLLPAEIGQLIALTALNLSQNKITLLPSEIGQLIALTRLDLSRNRFLSGLPNEILTLTRVCTIDLSGCGFSQAILERLRGRISAPYYRGPRIFHSIVEARRETSNLSLEELLLKLCIDAKELEDAETLIKMLEDYKEEDKLVLKAWLGRLSFMCDYNSSRENKERLCKNILRYFNLTNENEVFREQFYAIINGANETCGDRMALSILQLSVATKLATFDLKDLKNLAEFLKKGIWAIELLEHCAKEKVRTLNFVDEIEVYLAYPVMLKKKLKLPIDVDNMLYYACSRVNSDDLNVAAEYVKEQLENETSFVKFLIQNDKWRQALSSHEHYAKQYSELEDEKKQSIEDAADPDYKRIWNKYNAGLVELTRRALSFP